MEALIVPGPRLREPISLAFGQFFDTDMGTWGLGDGVNQISNLP